MVSGENEADDRLLADIAARLRQLCEALRLADGLSQGEIGLACGVEPSAWSLYLKGERKVPYSVVVELWRQYGAEPGWLIAGEARYLDPAFAAKLRALAKAPKEGKPRRGRPPTA
jgi:transcriptional regulator with XRE-family HTH domain